MYRRRKPPASSAAAAAAEGLPKGLKLTLSNNATSELTISDEAASTCTNLSLTPNSTKLSPRPFHNLDPVQHNQGNGSLMGMYAWSSPRLA